MRAKITIATLILFFICTGLSAQIPLVYRAENTGTSCTVPLLPSLDQLPVIQPLPDPFMSANGNRRSTSFSDWECRRNEIKAQIENYEIGIKPPRPDSITATYTPTAGAAGTPDTLRVYVTKNGKTLTITSQVYRPSVSGSFPAVIGMNSPSGSVPATVFTGRNIARITFNHNQVTTYGNPQLTDPFFQLYPGQNLVNSGQYSAWSWGVSRIIDGLELVQSSLPVDLNHIGVTGCSYAGKMALFAGALDERIALTIAQESGGGGAPSWRVSHNIEPNGSVEKIDNTDYSWFRDSMRLFSGENVYKLPEDHHELMAMIAPRALLVTGNTDYTWLSNKANYVTARATKAVYNTLGISERFGFYIDGAHAHCAVPAMQVPAMQAFVDKFLVGTASVNTDTITVNPFPTLDYQRWYQWWGTGNPVLPPAAAEPLGKRVWLEAECGTVGSDWDTFTDTAASRGKYVVVKSGLNSTGSAPAGSGSAIVLAFNIDSAASYNFLARVNCPTADDDSYWIKIDNGAFATINGLNGTGWQWVKLTAATLGTGVHTLTIAYREDGAKLDKVLVTTSNDVFLGQGDAAVNCADAPLPVSLVSYQAALRSTGEVMVRWSTAAELKNKQYRLERSGNGNTYMDIATIAASSISTGKSEYSYTDPKPLKGINYYRLIQEDIDGHESILGIKTVNTAAAGTTRIQVYPNPAHDELNIDLGTRENTQKTVQIYNMSGKIVFSSLLLVNNGMIKVNLGQQHPGAGLYLVKIGDQEQVRVVIR